MNANDWAPNSGNSPARTGTADRPRVFPEEKTLRTEKVQIERKVFVFQLKENPRGRFLRITEDVGGRHDAIIIPSTGLIEFKQLLEEMAKTSEESPPGQTFKP